MAARAVTREQLAVAAKVALGSGRRLVAVERVAGGSKKGVYRLVAQASSIQARVVAARHGRSARSRRNPRPAVGVAPW
ncbi:hypothetical protein ACFRAO_05960 [Streptomyces sp. NPDC056656]|uniref:hypothetical protein n=1 Tax=Streptomyces sp. NPDC056656 TaxID=3345895 RepID=UPI0036CC0AFA